MNTGIQRGIRFFRKLITAVFVAVVIMVVASIVVPALLEARRGHNEYFASLEVMKLAWACKSSLEQCVVPKEQPRGYTLSAGVFGGKFFVSARPEDQAASSWNLSGNRQFYTEQALVTDRQVEVLKKRTEGLPPMRRNQPGVEVDTYTIGDPESR